MPNYDSSQVGIPYIRVSLIKIDYPAPLTANVKINETLAVKLADDSIAQLQDLGDVSFSINAADMPNSVQLYHPDTGVAIPGATMTYQQIMLGLLAVIRTKQLVRDTPAPE